MAEYAYTHWHAATYEGIIKMQVKICTQLTSCTPRNGWQVARSGYSGTAPANSILTQKGRWKCMLILSRCTATDVPFGSGMSVECKVARWRCKSIKIGERLHRINLDTWSKNWGKWCTLEIKTPRQLSDVFLTKILWKIIKLNER